MCGSQNLTTNLSTQIKSPLKKHMLLLMQTPTMLRWNVAFEFDALPTIIPCIKFPTCIDLDHCEQMRI
jgi:hypothetical protein